MSSQHHIRTKPMPNLKSCRCGRQIINCIELPLESMRPGKFAICGSCGRIRVFDEHLNLKTPTVADFKAMPLETFKVCQAIRAEIRVLRVINDYFDDGQFNQHDSNGEA